MQQLRIKDTVSGPGYDIVITSGFSGISESLKALDCKDRRVLIVTDTNVRPLYLDPLKEAVKGSFKEIYDITVPAGEENKDLDRVRDILNELLKLSFDRKDFIIALGGGVIGDMAGFASAVFLRGIRFIQVPTTLLSQTDSSVGGKTGVDLSGYKNMVGSFHQPALVYINVSTLNTLSKRQFASGMAEVLKAGLIKDASFYEWLINSFLEINSLDMDALERMISEALRIKAEVVEEDPTEKGIRAILNFGHTIGHAIEKYYDLTLTHGECVAYGMNAASYISYRRGNIAEEDHLEIRDMLLPFNLPLTLPDNADKLKILEITKADKKMDGDRIRFILLNKIGEAYIDDTVTEEEILDAVSVLMG